MNSSLRSILILMLLAIAVALGFLAGKHSAGGDHDAATSEPTDEKSEVATVTTARVRTGDVTETFAAYGSVIADPGDVRVLSVQYESRVSRVLVTPGQPIDAGAELIAIEPSPDTKVSLQDAQNAADAAARDLKQTQAKFNEHLATNQELTQSQESEKAANLKLQSLLERGVDKPQQLKSPMAGVVSKVDVQEGQIVAAGAPLIEIAAQNRLEVKLGVEPDDAQVLKPDQTVTLRRVEGANAEEIEGHIRVVGNRIDPTTRLVDVLVSLPPDTKLILDSYVAGELPRSTVHGLVVPREALVAEQDGFSVFTIKDGHAYEHDVKVGVQNDHDAEIESDDVKEGDQVALVGSLELEDKMAVEVKEAATGPSSEAATKPAGKNEEKP
jgi:RND family efflux transporter MFP subunit